MPSCSTISPCGRLVAQAPLSTFPRTAITGAIRRNSSRISGRPTSPAWMISAEPCNAAAACGRSSPWVSEMMPMFPMTGERPRASKATIADRISISNPRPIPVCYRYRQPPRESAMRPFEALGLGYDELAAINPRLIYASFSAFGQGGPRREQTAYDHVIQATSGIMAMTGTKDVHPVKFGAPAIDYATGTTGAFALAAALFQRERTGRGQRIDMAMLDVAVILMSSHLTGYLRNGVHPKPHGNRHPHATNGAFQTKDGLIMLGASNLRQQKRLWTLLGRPDMIKRTNDERDADHAREIAVLEEMMRTRTADAWEQYLQANHVPACR